MLQKISDIKNWREWFLGLITLCSLVAVFSFPPIPQDPSYHQFADVRKILGVPNFWNVLSNFPFMLVGAFGLTMYFRQNISNPSSAYIMFCIGVFFVGVGSAYYHYNPVTQTLVWDRLPMTVAFMALFSMVVTDRISEKIGSLVFWPLVVAGVASVGYWYWSELQGKGDLRAYAVIQFLPMILTPTMLIMYTGKVLSSPWLWGTLGTYALSKVVEYFDLVIYGSIGGLSGHSIKHLLGALAVLWAILSYRRLSHGKKA